MRYGVEMSPPGGGTAAAEGGGMMSGQTHWANYKSDGQEDALGELKSLTTTGDALGELQHGQENQRVDQATHWANYDKNSVELTPKNDRAQRMVWRSGPQCVAEHI